MIEQALVDATAAALLKEHQNKQPYHPLQAPAHSDDLEDAYRIQDAFQQLLMQSGQGDIVGYKIALTSKAMQEMCGVDQPLAGAIFAKAVHQSPAQFNLSDFQHVGIEFEVAVKLKADLPATGAAHTRESVASAVASCMPAFELVEDRNADYSTMDAFSLIADNCWNGGNVLGQPVSHWQDLDLVNTATRLSINGKAADEGKIGDAMGHPFEVVAWVANLLNQRGKLLKKDMIVMTGSSMTTKFPVAGDRLEFSIDNIGKIELVLN